MASFPCRECGTQIPVDDHGTFAGMQISGPCPRCGSPMPFICPECRGLAVSLFVTRGYKCYKCQDKVMKKENGCYIATACYGDYDHPDVLVFRRFRDERLVRSMTGKWLTSAYYRVSPVVARRLGNTNWLSGMIRKRLLEPLAKRIKRSGI
jgi:hypothetical protein